MDSALDGDKLAHLHHHCQSVGHAGALTRGHKGSPPQHAALGSIRPLFRAPIGRAGRGVK